MPSKRIARCGSSDTTQFDASKLSPCERKKTLRNRDNAETFKVDLNKTDFQTVGTLVAPRYFLDGICGRNLRDEMLNLYFNDKVISQINEFLNSQEFVHLLTDVYDDCGGEYSVVKRCGDWRGYGVFANKDMVNGTKFCHYAGVCVIVSEDESNKIPSDRAAENVFSVFTNVKGAKKPFVGVVETSLESILGPSLESLNGVIIGFREPFDLNLGNADSVFQGSVLESLRERKKPSTHAGFCNSDCDCNSQFFTFYVAFPFGDRLYVLTLVGVETIRDVKDGEEITLFYSDNINFLSNFYRLSKETRDLVLQSKTRLGALEVISKSGEQFKDGVDTVCGKSRRYLMPCGCACCRKIMSLGFAGSLIHCQDDKTNQECIYSFFGMPKEVFTCEVSNDCGDSRDSSLSEKFNDSDAKSLSSDENLRKYIVSEDCGDSRDSSIKSISAKFNDSNAESLSSDDDLSLYFRGNGDKTADEGAEEGSESSDHVDANGDSKEGSESGDDSKDKDYKPEEDTSGAEESCIDEEFGQGSKGGINTAAADDDDAGRYRCIKPRMVKSALSNRQVLMYDAVAQKTRKNYLQRQRLHDKRVADQLRNQTMKDQSYSHQAYASAKLSENLPDHRKDMHRNRVNSCKQYGMTYCQALLCPPALSPVQESSPNARIEIMSLGVNHSSGDFRLSDKPRFEESFWKFDASPMKASAIDFSLAQAYRFECLQSPASTRSDWMPGGGCLEKTLTDDQVEWFHILNGKDALYSPNIPGDCRSPSFGMASLPATPPFFVTPKDWYGDTE